MSIELEHPQSRPAAATPTQWRVMWAIVRKDAAELRHNTQLLVLLSMPFLVFFLYRLLYVGAALETKLAVAVLDEGQSQLVTRLEALPDLDIHRVTSTDELRQLADDEDMQGIVIPAGFDAAARQGEQPVLTVYLNKQSGSRTEVERFQRLLQEQVLYLSGQTWGAEVVWDDAAAITHRTPFSEQVALNGYLFTVVLTMALYMAGTNVVSHLIAEEKEKHTLDSLLTSPARLTAFVAAKTIIGLLMGVIMFGLMTFFNGGLTGNWDIYVFFITLAILAYVGLGILTGLWAENTKQCNIWSSMLMFVVLMPSWFGSFLDVSEPWYTLFRLIPTHYLVTTLTDSLEARVTWGEAVPNLLIWLGTTLLVWLVVGWVVRTRPRRITV